MADKTINNGITYVKDTPVRGKDVWYFIQSTDPKVAPIGSPAVLPAHQTSGDTSIEGDSLDEQTKMGRVIAASTNEDSIEITIYKVPGDKTGGIINDAKHHGRQVKVWRVEVDPRLAIVEGDHKAYSAMFGYGVVDSNDISDEDSFSEMDFTLNIIGKLADKNADGTDATFPLSDEQIAALNQLYNFERPGETEGEFSDAAGQDDERATDITVTPSSVSVAVSGTKQLTVSAVPSDAADKDAVIAAAIYESADVATATVNTSGLVTGVKAGSTTVTIKSGSFTKTANVEVTGE
ncbi:phage major tail protein, TP901-1 family [Lactiplantibacillus plantarum]